CWKRKAISSPASARRRSRRARRASASPSRRNMTTPTSPVSRKSSVNGYCPAAPPSSTMVPIFVTSSGTEIGKTYVSAMLTRELKARALKPLVSGLDEETFPESDPAQLLAAMGEPVTYENAALVSRWRFKAALSPDMAAKREGRAIDFDDLVSECV